MYYYIVMTCPTKILYPLPPPTTNCLTSVQRAQLIRSTKKLGRILGTTPHLIDTSNTLGKSHSSFFKFSLFTVYQVLFILICLSTISTIARFLMLPMNLALRAPAPSQWPTRTTLCLDLGPSALRAHAQDPCGGPENLLSLISLTLHQTPGPVVSLPCFV